MAHAQSQYYWSGERQIEVTENKTLISAYFNQDIPESVASYNFTNEHSKSVHADRMALKFSADKEISDLTTEIQNLTAIGFELYYGFTMEGGIPLGQTNEVLFEWITQPSSNDLSYLESKKAQFGVVDQQTSSKRHKLQLSDPSLVFQLANTLYESGLFRFAHPNFYAEKVKYQDPLYNKQYYLHNTGQNVNGYTGAVGADCQAEEGWTFELGNSEITVAVIDDGVNQHEDLEDADGNSRVLSGIASFAALEGIVDPFMGGSHEENFLSNGCFLSHGEEMSGIIAASHNDIGTKGIAPGVNILPVNIFYGNLLTTVWHTAYGFDYARDQGADVINISWGYGSSCNPDAPEILFDVIHNAITDAAMLGRDGLGCVVSISAGNEGFSNCVIYPARHPNVIAVGASLGNHFPADYSNGGSDLDIVATSSITTNSVFDNCNSNQKFGGIYTTSQMENDICYSTSGCVNSTPEAPHYTSTSGGTSSSAALVSGAAALLLSKDANLSREEVAQYLFLSALDFGEEAWDPLYGWGILQLGNALEQLCIDNGEIEGICEGIEVSPELLYLDTKIVGDGETWVMQEGEYYTKGIEVLDGGLLLQGESTAYFGNDAKIKVHIGGQINLAFGALTSGCDNQMWRGIEVDGYDIYGLGDVLISEKGNVNLNNVVIENAHIGVATGFSISGCPDGLNANCKYFNYDGRGTIDVQNCDFINCGIGINFPSYEYAWADQTLYQIIGNTFVTNAELIDYQYSNQLNLGEYPNPGKPWFGHANSERRGYAGILMSYVDEGIIEGNTFENLEIGCRMYASFCDVIDNDFINVQHGLKLNAGAHPYNSNPHRPLITENFFSLVHDPNPEDALEPIMAELPMQNGPFSASIDEVLFNTAAIEVKRFNGFEIIRNDFGNIELAEDLPGQTAGILIQNGADFDISENRIFYHQYGAIVIDSDADFAGRGLIGKRQETDFENSFQGCIQNLVTNSDNLFFLNYCNDFIFEEPSTDRFWHNYGVLGDQGYDPGNTIDYDAGAGNFFEIPEFGLPEQTKELYSATANYSIYADLELAEILDESPDFPFDEDELDNYLNSFVYYHHGTNDVLNNPYQPYVIGNNNNAEVSALGYAFDPAQSCVEPPYMIVVGGGEEEEHLQQLNDLDDVVTEAISNLNAVKAREDDFQNNTDAMLAAIYGGIADEYELKEYLKDNSPLSPEVMEAYMLRYNVPHGYFQEVFQENSVIERELRDLLDARIQDFPTELKTYLLDIAIKNPYTETRISRVRELHQARKTQSAYLFSHLNYLREQSDEGTYVSFLEARGSRLCNRMLVDHYATKGDFQGALDALSAQEAVGEDAMLAKEIKTQYLQSLLDENADVDDQLLRTALSQPNGTESKSLAEALLDLRGVQIPILAQVSGVQTRSNKVYNWFTVENRSNAKVYPTHFDDYLNVQAPEGSKFTLFDATGKEMHQQLLTAGPVLRVELSGDLANGIYLYQLEIGSTIIDSGKLVKQ